MKKYTSILSIIALSLFFTSCSNKKTDSPSDVVKAYYTALQNGDIGKALSYTLIQEEQDKQTVADALKEKLKTGFQIKNFKIISEEIAEDGQQAQVQVETTIVPEKGKVAETDAEPLWVINVNGKWLVGILN